MPRRVCTEAGRVVGAQTEKAVGHSQLQGKGSREKAGLGEGVPGPDMGRRPQVDITGSQRTLVQDILVPCMAPRALVH